MPHTPLSDAVVDAIDVRPNPHPHHLLTEVGWREGAPNAGEPLPSVLANVFKLTHWSIVPKFAEAAAHRRDFGFNAIGFRYPEGLEPDEAAFAGVLVWDYYAKVSMSQAAFDRLCVRTFDALEAHARARTPDVLTEAWWAPFQTARAVVAARAAQA